MSLLNDILSWSTSSLMEWQRDALRRLFQKKRLDSQDYDDLYALLKSTKGLPDPEGRKPQPLGKEHLPPPATTTSPVVLRTMQDLIDVNRIAAGQSLEFAPTGMTVVYGGNGSGKSGYSRVLKRACRSRDLLETVLPDAYATTIASPIPQATFEVLIAGKPSPFTWRQDQTPPPELAAIAVFDGKCARAYLDSEQDVAFLPYGLDIVENLALDVMKELARRLDAEINSVDTDTAPFQDLARNTAVGRMVASLGANTNPKEIEALATISSDETKRLAELDNMLAEADPKAKARALRLSAQRLEALISRIDAAMVLVNDTALERLKTADSEAETATKAESGAATHLRAGEELLEGTGEQIWKLLFESARRYSTEVAYIGELFPNTGQGAKCPLCQEPLSQGAASRMTRFSEYLAQDIAKVAAEKRSRRTVNESSLSRAVVSFALDQALAEEITQLDAGLPEVIVAFEKQIERRKAWLLSALKGHDWSNAPALDGYPCSKVKSLAMGFVTQAEELDKAADESLRETLEKERAELRARSSLSARLKPILDLIQRMVTKAKLTKCKDSLKTTAISNKAKEFASQAVTATLKNALDTEFAALGVGHIKTELKERVVQGKMKHKIVLDLPIAKKVDLNQILSEGEQRAIAIGSFLAELQLSGHSGGIVFDDPVSSLDHHRRQNVARRLVEEASRRQVIVFTHDTAFLGELLDRIEQQGVDNLVYHLDWDNDRPGVILEGLPWGHKKVSDRFDALEKAQRDMMKSWSANPSEKQCGEMRRVYGFLRATVERVIQDVIFNGVVKRYRDWIRVDALRDVVGFSDTEYKEIARIHKACCDVVDAHDPSSAKNAPVPTVQQLGMDIADLKAVVTAIKGRRKLAIAPKATTP